MKTKTILKVIVSVVVIGGGLSFFMYQAMQSSWSYYYSVDDFANSNSAVKNLSFRIAGRVKQGSVTRDLEKMNLNFTLAGSNNEIKICYNGTVPDNFVEEGEVVVEGQLDTAGIFQADMLMTKCESKYKAKVK